MRRFWHRYAPYWHVCTGILFCIYLAVTWINTVSANSDKFPALEAKVSAQQTDIVLMKQDLNATRQDITDTKQEVHDIWKAMRLDKK